MLYVKEILMARVSYTAFRPTASGVRCALRVIYLFRFSGLQSNVLLLINCSGAALSFYVFYATVCQCLSLLTVRNIFAQQ